MTRRLFAAMGIVAAVAAADAANPKFTSTWKAPGAEQVSYAGKKVVGLIVSDDMPMRVSAEEALARELTAKGVEGVAAYKLIPREEIRNADHARDFVERAGASGVLVLRLVDLSKETTPSRVLWQSGVQYGSLWTYYPYVWGQTFDITPARSDVKIVIEMLVFDVAGSRLLWAGTSETTNPSGAQALIKSLVDGAADQMIKDGLIAGKKDGAPGQN